MHRPETDDDFTKSPCSSPKGTAATDLTESDRASLSLFGAKIGISPSKRYVDLPGFSKEEINELFPDPDARRNFYDLYEEFSSDFTRVPSDFLQRTFTTEKQISAYIQKSKRRGGGYYNPLPFLNRLGFDYIFMTLRCSKELLSLYKRISQEYTIGGDSSDFSRLGTVAGPKLIHAFKEYATALRVKPNEEYTACDRIFTETTSEKRPGEIYLDTVIGNIDRGIFFASSLLNALIYFVENPAKEKLPFLNDFFRAFPFLEPADRTRTLEDHESAAAVPDDGTKEGEEAPSSALARR